MDCSMPGFPVLHCLPQFAQTHVHWVSDASESGSRSILSLWPHGLYPARLLCPLNCPGRNTGVGCLSLLQGIFPTQESNPDLPHCRRILYCLSYQGSPPLSNHLTFISDCGEWETSRCNCQHLSCFSHICSQVEIQNLLPDSLPQFSESPGASQPEGEDGCQPCSRFPAKRKLES